MEVQLTDYENAAHAVFIVLLTRAIMNLGLNFYIPISKVRLLQLEGNNFVSNPCPFPQVDENMHRAHRRDAVNTEKFFFRKDLYSPQPGHACDPAPAVLSSLNGLPAHINSNGTDTNGNGKETGRASPVASCSSHAGSRAHSPIQEPSGPVEDEYAEFTINEIINGDGKGFPGLMGVVTKYLDSLDIAPEIRKQLEKSLQLIRRRADGAPLSLHGTRSEIDRQIGRAHV